MHGVQCTENIHKRLARAVDTTHAHSSTCSGRNGLAKSRFLDITTQEHLLLAIFCLRWKLGKSHCYVYVFFTSPSVGGIVLSMVRPYPACTDLRCRVWSRLL